MQAPMGGLLAGLVAIQQLKQAHGCSTDEAWQLWQESIREPEESNVISLESRRNGVAR